MHIQCYFAKILFMYIFFSWTQNMTVDFGITTPLAGKNANRPQSKAAFTLANQTQQNRK